ncbi:hypothetical protein ACQPU1_05620 [Clostridium paraputrificum]|uniref:hypothetical protein n=1 Tax=Clostridium paraputrificum TaxID=29363 RepID=UPI003D32B71C
MQKDLLIKILGKEDAVKLEDQVYNLRDITDEMRLNIASNMVVFEDEKFIQGIQHELEVIADRVKSIKDKMELPENTVGYTNSREYIKKYLSNMNTNIEGLIKNLNPLDIKQVIYHNNMVADLVLIY